MLEDTTEDGNEQIIPVPSVDGNTLKFIVQYLEHYAGDSDPRKIEAPLKVPLCLCT